MGLFDFLKKKQPQTAKIRISTYCDDRIKFEPPSYTVSNPLKSASGLYPHEILMLSYYKKYAAGAEPARFWQYTYGVDDVPALLNKLKKLGFANDVDLTDMGRAELDANQYVLYIHRNKYLDISMTEMSILVNKYPRDNFRDIIWGELNRQTLEHMKFQRWGLLRNVQFNMYLFLMEEKRYNDALNSLFSVGSKDINMANYKDPEVDIILPPAIIKAFRSLITKLDLDEQVFISRMEQYAAPAPIARFDAHTTACIAAAIVYGHPENVRL